MKEGETQLDKVTKTKEYLTDLFNQSEYLKEQPLQREYRYDHTLRVSYWGKEIATKEGLDVEALIVGCLLHDISYIEEMPTKEAWLNHGRRSAEIAKPFLETLGFDNTTMMDILYGIAIHVDNKSDFIWNKSILADSISDADNIDRFDVYRIYETLEYDKFSHMNNSEKIEYCQTRISRVNSNAGVEFATVSATQLFHERLATMKEFFEKMLEQCQRTV